jgi:DNA ligase D-like protein (predicted 3'-phosphoesterase)
MALEEYKKKRDLEKTPEPAAEVKGAGSRTYVIQKHQASHLHYDLRLEYGGVLRSWALPKEPPTEKGLRRLAVATEDHPVDYASFEGTIPEGHYGAGKVEIWDKGTFDSVEEGEGSLVVNIHGKKLTGRYALVKMKPTDRFPGENNWLLFKTAEDKR